MGTLRLIVEPVTTLPEAARGLLARVQQSATPPAEAECLIELIEIIVVYTFPRLSREKIAAMLELTDMRETRVYQEGREDGERALILRQLQRKLGEVPEAVQEQVRRLPLERLEALGEALFDFEEVADLQA